MTYNITDFNESWISETPMGVGGYPGLYQTIVTDMSDIQNYGRAATTDMGNGYYKLTGTSSVFYWRENDSIIEIIMSLTPKPHALVVTGIAKNPNYTGNTYATDLYRVALSDSGKSLRFTSDDMMTSDGIKVWKRLVTDGFKVSIYDKNNPSELIQITNPSELESYFKPNERSFARWQYVLSESHEKSADIWYNFRVMKIQESSGIKVTK